MVPYLQISIMIDIVAIFQFKQKMVLIMASRKNSRSSIEIDANLRHRYSLRVKTIDPKKTIKQQTEHLIINYLKDTEDRFDDALASMKAT